MMMMMMMMVVVVIAYDTIYDTGILSFLATVRVSVELVFDWRRRRRRLWLVRAAGTWFGDYQVKLFYYRLVESVLRE